MAMWASLSPRSTARPNVLLLAGFILVSLANQYAYGLAATTVAQLLPTCPVDPKSLGHAEIIPDFSEGQGCGIQNGYKIFSLNEIKLSEPALIRCDVVDTLANWLAGSVQPQALTIYGDKVVAIKVFASYSCRPRDNVSGATLSQHGLGKAIDLGSFTLSSGREIVVLTGWDGDAKDQAFLRAIRADACGPFHTVLGPGSDSYHANHLHLDLQEERRGGGPYCH